MQIYFLNVLFHDFILQSIVSFLGIKNYLIYLASFVFKFLARRNFIYFGRIFTSLL